MKITREDLDMTAILEKLMTDFVAAHEKHHGEKPEPGRIGTVQHIMLENVLTALDPILEQVNTVLERREADAVEITIPDTIEGLL